MLPLFLLLVRVLAHHISFPPSPLGFPISSLWPVANSWREHGIRQQYCWAGGDRWQKIRWRNLVVAKIDANIAERLGWPAAKLMGVPSACA